MLLSLVGVLWLVLRGNRQWRKGQDGDGPGVLLARASPKFHNKKLLTYSQESN